MSAVLTGSASIDRATGWVLPLGLVGSAAIVLLPCLALIVSTGFDGLYGQDAFGYTDYARGELASALRRLELPPWFYWPPGYPLLIVTIGAVGGDRDGQLVSLLAGSLIPVLTTLLALELQETGTSRRARLAVALLAGALAATAGQLWQSSVVAMADTSGCAMALLGAWATCRFVRTGGARWLVLGAAATTIAIEIRWVYGLVALPIAAAALHTLRQQGRAGLRGPLRAAAFATVVAGLAALPTAAPIAQAILQGAPLPFAADFAAYRWSAASALESSFQTIDGRLTYEQATGVFYISQPLRRYWLWLPAVMALPGLLVALRRPTVPVAAVLVAWPALVVGFLAGSGYQNTRFFLAALPPVAILAALGTGWLWKAVGRPLPVPRRSPAPGPAITEGGARRRTALRVTLVAGLTLAMALNARYAADLTRGFIDRQLAGLTAIRSLAALAPPNARLISLGATASLRHEGREVAELYWLDGPAALRLVADERPTYVLVDRPSIEGQWAGRSPGLAIAALESGPGLEPIGTAGGWTLYRVGE